ncbi:condensation domain-containing protein [Serratia ficaria]|uniref:condensation domain-containing protein n=1 Tax=Serratia ficaria TaxID=61651 RepID=UPI00077CB743|nr:condensation domain-containing protein [Serratia ficaria]CAI0931698.1 Dimodular nonribosomal peptide synthase [Serratia ficaria]CAI1843984.1 Dimodular nonribosomal peptide synthase [Serratia ficaria]
MLETALASEWLPLAPAQLDFWEEFTLHPDQPFSTVAHSTELRGVVDETALGRAIALTIAETQAFALRFDPGGEGQSPQLRHDPQRMPALRRMDVQDQANPHQAALRLMRADVDQRMDLHRRPIAAVWLIKLGPTHYIWYLRAHHIVVDGYGMALIEHRCAALYAHFLGQGAGGQPLGGFLAFHRQELGYAASERGGRDRLFWQGYLPPAPPLPTVRKGGQEYGIRCLSTSQLLPEAVSRRLLQLSERSGIGWPDLLLALSAAWLHQTMPHQRAAGDTLPMWMPAMNRRGRTATNVPALAVNTLPLLVTLAPGESLERFLPKMAATLRELRGHAGYRLRHLAADRGVDANSRFFISPFINVQPFDPPSFVGCASTRRVLAGGSGDGFNLTYRGRTDASDLHVDIDVFIQQFPPGAAGYGDALQGFLQRALQPGGLALPLGALMAVSA